MLASLWFGINFVSMAHGAETPNSTRLVLPDTSSNSHHVWRIVPISGQTGYFRIESRVNPAMFLDSYAQQYDHVAMHMRRYVGHFRIENVNPGVFLDSRATNTESTHAHQAQLPTDAAINERHNNC